MPELTEEQFIQLVKKSEKAAEENPGAYKFKLALFAILGYAVIFTIITLLFSLIGGTIGIAFISSSLFLILLKKKFIIVIALAIWTFFKALWVKFDPPEGYELEREKYPLLFDEIDDLTKKLDALKINQVLLQDNLNAAVVQSPRFGLLGGQRNVLMLGIQLLLAVSPEEMRSVLAHEFGHLSGNHSRFAGWIYRVRIRWYRIMHAFSETDSFGASLMRGFFNWYAPKFSAYSFALARGNEYEADQVAAELTSPEIAARALVNIHAKAPYINEQYWDKFIGKADELPEPPNMPFDALAEFLKKNPLSDEQLSELVSKEMQNETHYADTHPALKDRVSAIVSEPVTPRVIESNAAEVWLGDQYDATLEYFDKTWADRNTESWENRYKYVQDAKSKLKEYQAISLSELDDDKLWEYSQITNEFKGDDDALPIYQDYQQRHPGNVGSAYQIGRILYVRKEEAALEYLKIAQENLHTIEDVTRWGYDLLTEKDRKTEAEEWWNDAMKVNERLQAKAAELNYIDKKDKFEKPVIDEKLLAEVKEKIAKHKKVGKCWLAQKVMTLNADEQLYVLAFKVKGMPISYNKVQKELAESLDIDAHMIVVALAGDSKKLAKKAKKAGIQIS